MVVLFEIGPKLISDIRCDTMSFDIGAKLSTIPIIILHVLRGRLNQCFGNCMGFAKLNSMSNYIRCLQTLLGDSAMLGHGSSLLLEAITFMFKEVHRLLFLTFTNQKLVHVVFVCLYSVCEVNKVIISTLCSCMCGCERFAHE